MNTMCGTIKIPKHSKEALWKIEEHGVAWYDFAEFQEDGSILAYKRWGRGFIKHHIRFLEGDTDGMD